MSATSGRALDEVAPGVLVATAPLYATTSTLLGAEDGSWIVVDPAITPEEVIGLAEAVASRGHVTAGFSTHAHWDHVLWCAELGEVPRWTTPTAARVAAREHAGLVEGARTIPGHDSSLTGALTALDGDRLPWSREVVVVEHGAHAPGSAALVLPDAGVMIAGDMLSDVEVPLLDLDEADPLAAYRSGLQVLSRAVQQYGVTIVVPGHGNVLRGGDVRERIRADLAYLDALAAGREPDDLRLDDPSQRHEHERQRAAVS